MKKSNIIFFGLLCFGVLSQAQTNTFPNSGNVGISTTTPSHQLTVGNSTNSANLLKIDGIHSDVLFNGTHTNGNIWSFINSGTGEGTRLYVQDANNLSSRLTFDFKGNAGNNDILAGTSNGLVGIGTTSPDSKLEVSSNSSTDATGLRLTNTGWACNMSTSIEFRTGNNKSVATSKISSIMNGCGNAGDRLAFFVQENGTNPNNTPLIEKLSLLPNGNLGIGTTKPNQKLHINGNLGIGSMGNTQEGFKIDYSDGGSGTTTFKSNRWGGDIYFKRNSSQGERTQISFGGSSEHYMNIYNSNDEVRVKFASGGNSYFNGGNLGIGTTTPDSKLTVKGNIHTNEVKVDLLGAIAPDYVFYRDYDLKTLHEVENYISKHGHLPNIPSAKAMETDGIKLKEMNLKLLEKIEELTLYTIEQEKEIKILKSKTSKVDKLENRLQKLEALLGSKH